MISVMGANSISVLQKWRIKSWIPHMHQNTIQQVFYAADCIISIRYMIWEIKADSILILQKWRTIVWKIELIIVSMNIQHNYFLARFLLLENEMRESSNFVWFFKIIKSWGIESFITRAALYEKLYCLRSLL